VEGESVFLDRICSPDAVSAAVAKVATRRHSSGPDGVRREAFRDWWARHGQRVVDSVIAGTYRPGEVRPIDSRYDSEVIFSENLHARVVSGLLLPILYGAYDPLLPPEVIGFRPRCNQYSRLRAAERLKASSRWVATISLQPFVEFDLPHSAIRRMLGLRLPSAAVELVGRLLAAPIRGHGEFTRGIRRGLTLSPALVNIAMHHILDACASRAGRPWLRYQGDLHIGIVSEKEAKALQTLALETRVEDLPTLTFGEFYQARPLFQPASDWLEQAPTMFHLGTLWFYRNLR